MDFDTRVTYFAVGIIVVLVVITILGFGTTEGKSSAANDCENYGKFIVNDNVYKCEKVGE